MISQEEFTKLNQKLLAKSSEIGILETQNRTLKAKLHEMNTKGNKSPKKSAITKSSAVQTDNSLESKMAAASLPPKTPVANKQDQEESIPPSPQVTELSNTLSNLKWGFKRREESLKLQLETHKEALYTLYGSYDQLRRQYRNICSMICNQLDDTENYITQRKEQTNRLEQREQELFLLWEKLKELEATKERESLANNLPPKIVVDEDRPFVKRVKSEDGRSPRSSHDVDDRLEEDRFESVQSPGSLLLKRKHRETSSASANDLVITGGDNGSYDELDESASIPATTEPPPQEESEENEFYEQHKGFGVSMDFLLSSLKKPDQPDGGNNEELRRDSDDPEYRIDTEEGPPEVLESEEIDEKVEEEGETDELQTTTTSLHLEDLLQSPIPVIPQTNTSDDVDSVDSLYGLQAMIASPDFKTSGLSPASFVSSTSISPQVKNRKISQNLFGTDLSTSKSPLLPGSSDKATNALDTSFELSSDRGIVSKDSESQFRLYASATTASSTTTSVGIGSQSKSSLLMSVNNTNTTSIPPTVPSRSNRPIVESIEMGIQTEEVEDVAPPPPLPKIEVVTAETQTEVVVTTTSTRAIQAGDGSTRLPPPKVTHTVAINTDPLPAPTPAPVIAAPSVVTGTSETRLWTQDDQEYFELMEAVQYQLGERLVELDFEKELAMKELKETMKSTILSSIHHHSDRVVIESFSPESALPSSPNTREKKQSEIAQKVATSTVMKLTPSQTLKETARKSPSPEAKLNKKTTKSKADTSTESLTLLQEEKEILSKRLFTLQEKIRSLEATNQQSLETIAANQTQYTTEKELQLVKIQELERKNQQYITLLSELRMHKVTVETGIQTEKKQKSTRKLSSKPRVINLDHYNSSDESGSGSDDGDEDDELSRLLFQDPLPQKKTRTLGTATKPPTTNNNTSVTSLHLEASAIFPPSQETSIHIDNEESHNNTQSSLLLPDQSQIAPTSTFTPLLIKTVVRKPSMHSQTSQLTDDNEGDMSSNTSQYSIEEKSLEVIATNTNTSHTSTSYQANTSALIQEEVRYYNNNNHPSQPLPPHPSSTHSTNPSSPLPPMGRALSASSQPHTGFINIHQHPSMHLIGYSYDQREIGEEDSNRNIFHDGNTITSSIDDELSSTTSMGGGQAAVVVSKGRKRESTSGKVNKEPLKEKVEPEEEEEEEKVIQVESDPFQEYLDQQLQDYEQQFDREIANIVGTESLLNQSRGIAFTDDNEKPEEEEKESQSIASYRSVEAPRRGESDRHQEKPTTKEETNLRQPAFVPQTTETNNYVTASHGISHQHHSTSKRAPIFEEKRLSGSHLTLTTTIKDRELGEELEESRQSVNLESFEVMRLEWENQQLVTKQHDLVRENQKLLRELELYRTKIFTVVQTEQSQSLHHPPHLFLQDLPDINITYQEGGIGSNGSLTAGGGRPQTFQYLSQTTTSSQTLYIIHQLITNNNTLIDRLQTAELQQQRLGHAVQEKDQEIDYLTKELRKLEIQTARMKTIVQQASQTITVTEQDYEILQKQVEILTKKLQLVMNENQKLSSYYHSHYSTSITNSNNSNQELTVVTTTNTNHNNSSNHNNSTNKSGGNGSQNQQRSWSNALLSEAVLSAKKEKIIADLLQRSSKNSSSN